MTRDQQQQEGARVTRVTVVTGFLGSGKTTLVKRLVGWLEANQQRVMVFVNDLAEYNFDAKALGFVAGEADQTQTDATTGQASASGGRRPAKVLQLQNGCICCTLGDDLVLTLMDAFEKEKEKEKERDGEAPSPWLDRVVIETSGVSDPYPICASIRSLSAKLSCRKLELDAVVCLVDVAGFQDMFLRSLAMKNQIQAADVVLLNKMDLAADEKQIKQVDRIVQKMLSPHANATAASDKKGTEHETEHETESSGGRGCRTMRCVRANVDVGLLMDTGEFSSSSNKHQQQQGQGPVFSIANHQYQSCSFVLQEEEEEEGGREMFLDMGKFHSFLQRLPKAIIRAKGFVRFSCLPTMVFEFHLVGQTYEANQVDPWQDRCSTSLVLIGSSIHKSDLYEKFKQCLSLDHNLPLSLSDSAARGTQDAFRLMIEQDKRFQLLPLPEEEEQEQEEEQKVTATATASSSSSVVAFTLRGHYGRFGKLSADLVEAANRELSVRLSKHSLLVVTGKGKGGVSTIFVDAKEYNTADLSRWQVAIQRETFVVLSNLVDPQQQALYQVGEEGEGKP